MSVIVCAASWTTLSPQAASLAVAAHVAEHHEGSHDARRPGAGPALVWHAHAHAPDTPSHRHVLAAANAIPAPSKALLRPDGRAPLLSAVAPLLGSPSAGWLRPPTRAGVGPPARVAAPSILRI
ncbi:MAG: hypothetical protein AB7O37_01305 [Vicinamibacteria bacterium]